MPPPTHTTPAPANVPQARLNFSIIPTLFARIASTPSPGPSEPLALQERQGFLLAALDEYLAPVIQDCNPTLTSHHYHEVFVANRVVTGGLASAEELDGLTRSAQLVVRELTIQEGIADMIPARPAWYLEPRFSGAYERLRRTLSLDILFEALQFLDGLQMQHVFEAYRRFWWREGTPVGPRRRLGFALCPWSMEKLENVTARCDVPEDAECSICREDMEGREGEEEKHDGDDEEKEKQEDHYAVRTACDHVFGGACLASWVGRFRINNATCPMCRRILVEVDDRVDKAIINRLAHALLDG
ncbi:hypothetical protein BU16DRAFT_525428 [Lophium mytilinum]|uniref:RING-type domain-containing protein n=1 Tax=Lophium mytilinum TaxID=390894 RepID=A0A6A6R006_9PEZI|nr:hypothetical protein BU16DRAFT_525428 [Lophium mytilinum]